ncbi:MAG TPA: hypothetical protein VNE21_02780 [Mycobacteriales bacterium]|nr:hypothetical protein [Mycobacteriales bacterium]
MTWTPDDHAVFEELAAGHALHALDPDDEQLFRVHAEDCERCRRQLGEFAEVAAALAMTAAPAVAPPGLGSRIRTAALADADDGVGGQVVPITRARRHSRERPWVRIAAAVAVAAAVAGGGIWGGVAATRGGSRTALAGCPAGCHEITLLGAGSRLPDARVVVRGTTAYLTPTGLAADNAVRTIYVLWQVTGKHTPLPVGSFDVRSGVAVAIPIGSLAAPYGDTWAFAVSLEQGRTIPATPSHPVALGLVSS